MWGFGYGSLMWDGWERPLQGVRVDRASLPGHRRSFNKGSVRNWGSDDAPGPTLGLESDATGACVGTAFEFPDERAEEVKALLKKREGGSFCFPELQVRLPDGRTVPALTPVNDLTKCSYIGRKPLAARAAMARSATGDRGACADYVRNIHRQLCTLGIEDEAVEEFVRAMDT
jgi:cation transport protein ChaC